MTWIQKWEVDGSNGKVWIVALSDKGTFGCSCPSWKFRRVECHHIKYIKDNYYYDKPITYTEAEQYLLTMIHQTSSTLNH